MNLKVKKTDSSKIIRSMFSAIKKDDIEKFKEIIKEYPEMLHFKNHRRENILFYAFENNSKKIIDFVNSCEPGFIKEKNIRNLNILHELVLTGKNIDYFLQYMDHWDSNSIQQLFINADPQGNNVILMSAKSGNSETLKKVIKSCPFFKDLQKHSNIYGQTVAHFIASHITEDCDEIIKTLSPELLKALDNINGFSPLMLAAFHQKENNFKSFFEISPSDQESFFNNNLIHFAAHNKEASVTKFLISKGLYKNNKNISEQSPLLISLIKGHDDVAEELFEQAKNHIIYQEDIITSVKIANKNSKLFNKIINNQTNEELSKEGVNTFLENLFFSAKYQTILDVANNDKYSKHFEFLPFNNLFAKTLIGKKDMSLKTNFLLSKKKNLTRHETIEVVNSLQKIPGSQIKFILSSTDILQKTIPENRQLFIALCLTKGIDYSFIDTELEVNKNDDIQKAIKKSLRSVKIEETEKHFNNINLWLNLLEDKKVVWKHYGRIIAKAPKPFWFIDGNFKFLDRESKKELIYYSVTALFKDEKQIEEETFEIIKSHINLLSNVFTGIIKVGKIPKNNQLLEILPKIKSKNLFADDLVNLLKKNSKNPKEVVNLLKETIPIFDLNEIQDIKGFCKAITSNEFHHEIMEEIVMNIGDFKDEFIYAYVDSYIELPNATINMEVLEHLVLSEDNPNEIISNILNKALAESEFNNIDFIKRIHALADTNVLPKIDDIQKLVDEEDFSYCLKLQKLMLKDFPFKKIDFNNVNWESINIQTLVMDKNGKFFDFLSENSHHITEKQINDLTSSLLTKFVENKISLETIDRYFNALDKNMHKIEDDLMYNLSIHVLDNHFTKDNLSRFISQNSFNSIFNSISHSKDGKFFERIKDNGNYNMIPNEARIIMNKEILEESLSSLNINMSQDPPRIKKVTKI